MEDDWEWLTALLTERSHGSHQPHEIQNPLPSLEESRSNSDSDYEYEYDDSETDTFYVNVDLNSSGWSKWSQPGGGVAVDEAATSTTRSRDATANVSSLPEAQVEQHGHPLTGNTVQKSDALRSIQIIDLHHERPILKYQNQLFEGHWANVIGTELICVPASAPVFGPIVKEGNGYKIVAANSVKLICNMLTISELKNHSTGAGEPHPMAIPVDEPNDEFRIPSEATAMRKQQTLFLQRLATIKRHRGETDKVFVHNSKAMNASGPRGPHKRRRRRRKDYHTSAKKSQPGKGHSLR